MTTRYTPSGVRMRLHSSRAGNLDWLLLPGGPGLGSESLQELADVLNVPGSVWLVDLPGDEKKVSGTISEEQKGQVHLIPNKEDVAN